MMSNNGYDQSKLTPYKYDLRRVSSSLYVGSDVKGGSVVRDRFLVKDLHGNYWCYYKTSSYTTRSSISLILNQVERALAFK